MLFTPGVDNVISITPKTSLYCTQHERLININVVFYKTLKTHQL